MQRSGSASGCGQWWSSCFSRPPSTPSRSSSRPSRRTTPSASSTTCCRTIAPTWAPAFTDPRRIFLRRSAPASRCCSSWRPNDRLPDAARHARRDARHPARSTSGFWRHVRRDGRVHLPATNSAIRFGPHRVDRRRAFSQRHSSLGYCIVGDLGLASRFASAIPTLYMSMPMRDSLL